MRSCLKRKHRHICILLYNKKQLLQYFIIGWEDLSAFPEWLPAMFDTSWQNAWAGEGEICDQSADTFFFLLFFLNTHKTNEEMAGCCIWELGRKTAFFWHRLFHLLSCSDLCRLELALAVHSSQRNKTDKMASAILEIRTIVKTQNQKASCIKWKYIASKSSGHVIHV